MSLKIFFLQGRFFRNVSSSTIGWGGCKDEFFCEVLQNFRESAERYSVLLFFSNFELFINIYTIQGIIEGFDCRNSKNNSQMTFWK
jgi:hypothetical protein